MKLSDLAPCFQGVTPASIATCDADGVPNVTLLSQVHYLDEQHVALSCQFFNKTRRNVDQNPYASVRLWHPVTLQPYVLALRFQRAETSGPLFDEMSSRIDAIARVTGMQGIFKLLSADVYEVCSIAEVTGALSPAGAEPQRASPNVPRDTEMRRAELRGLQQLSARMCRARPLDELFGALLESVTSLLAAPHAVLLLHDEARGRLTAIDSKGYERSGAGAEVQVGEGLIGAVAASRMPLALSGMHAVRRYARAVHVAAREGGAPLEGDIPLPELHDAQAQLALPLVADDRLVGVLALESRDPLAFEEWHQAYLTLLANQAASAASVAARTLWSESLTRA